MSSRSSKMKFRLGKGATKVITLNVNRRQYSVDVDPATPLLWVIRENIGLAGTKYGCGMAQCGACTVHIDGEAVRSCVTPVSRAAGKIVTTIEGLSADLSDPLQRDRDRCAAVRLLPIRSDHECGSAASREANSQR